MCTGVSADISCDRTDNSASLAFLVGWAVADKEHLPALPEFLVRGLKVRFARVRIAGVNDNVLLDQSFPAGDPPGHMHLSHELEPCALEISRPLGGSYTLTLNIDACPGTLTAGQRKSFDTLANLIHGALECLYVGQHVRQSLGTPFHHFSDKEWNVCEALDGPESEKAIAAHIGSSPHTVHCHVKSVYKKLLVQSRLEVIHHLRKARAQFRRAAIFTALGRARISEPEASGQEPVRASA